MDFLLRLIISSLAILVTALVMPGVQVESMWTAILVALVLSVLNAIVKPVLVILTIPITLVTLGIFLLVINAIIILLADKIVPGFQVNSFWSAFFFSIVLSLVTAVLERLAKKEE